MIAFRREPFWIAAVLRPFRVHLILTDKIVLPGAEWVPDKILLNA
jgi:hypothetical protein